ncbi:cell growth-regulating nucleolar protein-like [Watersipora subatra]|uniref:cell growth-regulating nucleolar protein-like n=1 Tax=Watersipora subatra TaxID=2589382 RepID=UPI00355C7432
MVYFTCGHCNATLKKNQVDQHCQYQCKNAKFVSCVDCGTDFYGGDYASHTTCVSEAQKYGGKDYVEKGNVNKGQKKQDLWVETVQQVLERTKTDDPRVKQILEGLTTLSNIPQKKAKFLNFLKSSFSRFRHDQALFEQVWCILEEGKKNIDGTNDSGPTGAEAKVVAEKAKDKPSAGQKKKKERKSSKTEEVAEDENEAPADIVAPTGKDKKKKKKKRRGEEEEEEVLDEEAVAAMREKKWRKRDPEMEDVERLNDTLQEVEKQPKDFNLGRLITSVLERKGSVSLKNLRKKALGEFWECGVGSMTEEKVLHKLDKKLRSMQGVKIINDKVYLEEEDD